MLTGKQLDNLRDRIEQDAKSAIDELVAKKLRGRNYGSNEEQAKIIADCDDEIASSVVNHLFNHYTIRDRVRSFKRKKTNRS